MTMSNVVVDQLVWETSSQWANPDPGSMYTLPLVCYDEDGNLNEIEFFVKGLTLYAGVWDKFMGKRYYSFGEFCYVIDNEECFSYIRNYADFVLSSFLKTFNFKHVPFEIVEWVDDNFNPIF